MCVLGKENYCIKTHKYQNITYVEKCQYEKLKQKINECLICFSNLKIIQTSLHFLHKGRYLEVCFVWA